MNIVLESEAKTRELAGQISSLLEVGDVVLLNGPLGCGKTSFVKGLASALGVSEAEVSSPTFIIAQKYEGERMTIHHLDLYRLDEISEIQQILQELPDGTNKKDGVLLIEWGSKANMRANMFEQYLDLTFDYPNNTTEADNVRLVSIKPHGKSWESRISTLQS